jgi:GT2 family glycosyltransferase/glycosyltransferase involved in cell wall biosynthesis
MRNANQLFGLPAKHGVPMLMFQGFGTPNDPVVHANLVLAPHAICTSSWLVDEAVQARCTASLVRYGLDRQIFLPGGPAEARGPLVAMMTHPLDWKGTADGLEALRLAQTRLPEIEVRLFGKAKPDFDGATYLAAPNKPSDVAALLRESAVFVCSSWEEGFGLPGIEAIASGAALATTDTKGSRDYAFHDRTALVSAPRDPESLSENIVQLMRDPGLRTRLIDAGRRHIEMTYPNWERATEEFVAVVHTAAGAVRSDGRRAAPPMAAADELALDAEARAAHLGREARRANLLLREGEIERHELEAELGRRTKERTDNRRRIRELNSELERERDSRERAEATRATTQERADRLAIRLAENEQRVSELQSAAQISARELASVQQELEATIAALRELDHQLELAHEDHQHARRGLEDRLRRADEDLRRTELAQAQARRELAQARGNAEVAQAERAAFAHQVTELLERVERSGATDAAAIETIREPVSPDDRNGTGSAVNPLTDVMLLPSAAIRRPALPASERKAAEAFTTAYLDLVGLVPAATDERDPLALPLAVDVRGMLVPRGEQQEPGQPSVDVVICVHNALDDVRRCLWSLLHKATRRFRLIAVNDGSDESTTAFLGHVAAAHPAVTLIDRTAPPHGYTLAANAGMRASSGDYVVLLNSDTVVSHWWLERIIAYGERHERVGILGPLSNAATHQSVPERRSGGEWATNPLPGWLTEDGMALILQRAAPRTDTRVPFVNGFCYVIRRAVLAAIGYFDQERFAPGYAEENDYSQRARDAGFELAVVDDAYVYHAKSKSYGLDRRQISKHGYQAFLEKHGRDKIDALVKTLEGDSTLSPVRTAVADAVSTPEATQAALAQKPDDDVRLTLAFVLPGLSDGGSGGSHSIYQEVHGLRRLNVPARILVPAIAYKHARNAYDDAADVFETFADASELTELTASANVIIATHFKSVAMVAALLAQRDDFLPAYYVQDYEAMFRFADDRDNEEAAGSYTAIPGALLFAKTHWLCNVVASRHGVFVAKVEPSIDATLYRATPPPPPNGVVRITAMLRPRTPRRQPYGTVAVLERLLDERPESVAVRTFGCRKADLSKVTKSETIHAGHQGLLKRDHVADLLRDSDVFLDMSSYQAFGRTALEAMACGCTAVVPRLGGVWDFVDQGQNALAVDTMDQEAAFVALASLVDDNDRLARLKAGALATGARYSILRAAISEYAVLRQAYRSRFG